MAEWDKYESRFPARPETFAAYVDVWTRVPAARRAFSGWVSFSQAANAEPAQRRDRVRAAEDLMRQGGYQIGAATPRGARRWVRKG
jgi:hypothetical protein